MTLDHALITKEKEYIESFRNSIPKQLKTKHMSRCQKHFHQTKQSKTINKVSNKYSCSLNLQQPKTASHKDAKDASRKLNKSPYPVNTPANMMLPKKKQNRFQLSLIAKEVPAYIPTEACLMDDLDILTRSDIYKITLKNLYRQRKQAQLEFA